MGPAVQPPIAQSLSFHAYSPDQKFIAVSKNDAQVVIYETGGKPEMKGWQEVQTLGEHSEYISAIDWAPSTNLIVTAAHDRNAYVWKQEGGSWKPTLVILRINRAATGVRWSPNGTKFAVSSGSRCVPVCHFEEAGNWWISKMIKKHKSTVSCLAWAPNNKLLVTGSTDFKCRLFSAYIDGVDDAGADELSSKFSKWNEFGECLAEFDEARAWINAVAWSPDSLSVTFAGHGSTVHVADLSGGAPSVSTTYHKELPFNNLEYVDNNTLVASGFDNNPTIFKINGGKAEIAGKLDPEKPVAAAKATSSRGAAFSKFSNADSKGGKFGAKEEVNEPLTIHKNLIVDMRLLPNGKISTSSIDGRVYIWDPSQTV
jgi:actin related protein 2/3 complex subunit 1A/1B